MTALNQLEARRAIESLRSGVPGGAVVHALGWANAAQVQRLEDLLAQAAAAANGGGPVAQRGLLVKGDFGTGKSHLLAYLKQLALNKNFVVSRVVISKETPLFKPDKVFAAAVRDGKVPGNRGSVLHELAPRIDFRKRLADDLLTWADQTPGMLAGSINLLQHNVELGDDELIARIIDWWSGEKLSVSNLRTGLRKLGAQKNFEVKAIKAAELTALRIALTSQIIRAAGFAGWVILLDEIELIGRYSKLQRANSYAQLAHWFGLGAEHATPSTVCVGAITPDFEERILDAGPVGKDDRDGLPAWLLQRGKPGDAELATRVSKGIELLDTSDALHLAGPDEATLQHTYDPVRDLYRMAFDWSPPHGTPRLLATNIPMRTYIKTWIYEWDLIRLHVTESPSIEIETMDQGYEEDPALEQVGEEER